MIPKLEIKHNVLYVDNVPRFEIAGIDTERAISDDTYTVERDIYYFGWKPYVKVTLVGASITEEQSARLRNLHNVLEALERG